MRVGIVGAGLQARRRSPVIKKDKSNEIIIISAAHLDRAKELANEMDCEAAEGWEWVRERDDIDIVLVCTPPHIHAPISIAAMESGKHVLCEKPLSRTMKEAKSMVETSQKIGKILKCGFNHRHHPGIQWAKRAFDNGDTGKALFIRSRYGICGRPGYKDEWRADPKIVSGGHLMEQGIHIIDLARWFLGEFNEVVCFNSPNFWKLGNLEDNSFALYRTSEGRVFSIHSSLTQWKNLFSFEIFGEEGYIIVEGLGGAYGNEKVIFGRRDFYKPFESKIIEFRGSDKSWEEEWKVFIDCILNNRTPEGNGEDGLKAMELVFYAYKSAKEKRIVGIS